MCSFLRAAQLNAQGISALIQGNQASAINLITESVLFLKSALVEDMELGSDSEKDASRGDLRQYQSRTVLIPSGYIRESQDTMISAFDHVFQIQERSMMSNRATAESETELRIYSSAILFNLAFAHHYDNSGNSYQQLIWHQKAEKLYEMVLTLLEEEDYFYDDTISHLALMVKLACLNNLSYLCYARGDYSYSPCQSHHVFLNQVSMFLIDEEQMIQHNQASKEEIEVMQMLLTNVILLRPPTAARAA